MTSVVIPARNETFLQDTIRELLHKASGKIEVIAVLDGYWPPVEQLVEDKRVSYIHFSESRGMRACINAGVGIAKGEYIMKLDAHCMVADGFDGALEADCDDNWVVVPTRRRLDPYKWTLIEDGRPPIKHMYLSHDLHGREDREANVKENLRSERIVDLMSFQGSCWFMKRSYFDWLELMDEEEYGTFPREAQEIGLKCWLSGGRVVRNKKTWYAHWHKSKADGRGYSLDKSQVEKGTRKMEEWKTGRGWHKQTKPLSWLFEYFGRNEK
jgi:glycosyltransferase involved in cell wall biosynthesis